MDRITKEVRSRNMSHIRSKNTRPELILRKLLFLRGLRYRIHYPLPGKPDIVFPKKKIAIFVHGCFWHGHGCRNDHVPQSNSFFWKEKIKNNRNRDAKSLDLLSRRGWSTPVFWECEINDNLTKIKDWIIKSMLLFNDK